MIRSGEEEKDLTSSKWMYHNNASPMIALLLLGKTINSFNAFLHNSGRLVENPQQTRF